MGMDLVPVYEDEVSGGPTIRIDPVTEQNMGIRYAKVRRGPLDRKVRTLGLIQYDESGLGTVSTRVDGWIEKLHVQQTGTQVHAGDPLFDLYSPQLYSVQDEFLTALRATRDAAGRGEDQAAAMVRRNLESARMRLRLYDISEAQISALEKDGVLRRTLTVSSRLTGIVIHKGVVDGDHVRAGAPVYRIADLSTVWVMGKVYESDLPFIRLGQEARMTLDYLPGREWRGRVTYVYPYLEPGSREVPVRMEFHNPGYDLKPGMYATLEVRSRRAEQAVLVPAPAVLRSGERNVVFVAAGDGSFEPRSVAVGSRGAEDEYEVRSGLAPGETVVLSGQFLLDSESRLREATLKMLDPSRANPAAAGDPVRAATGPGGGAPSGPVRYVCPMPSHASVLHDVAGRCPLCGMTMVPVSDWSTEGSPLDHYTCPMPVHRHVRGDAPGKCPECGMTLIPITREEAERFRRAGDGTPAPSLYTCPMPAHADVVRAAPGACPRCGMTLVPTAQVPHGRDAERHWREAREREGREGHGGHEGH